MEDKVRGVAVSLPDHAAARLGELQLQRDAALDSANGARQRLNALPRDSDQRLRDALAAECDKQQQRFNLLSRLLSATQQWLTELHPGVVLEIAPPVDAELKPGETLGAAIEALRTGIASTKQHLAAVRSAPLPLADQKRLAAEFIERAARTAKPTVAVVRDQLTVRWRDDVIAGREDLLATLAWLAPQAVLAAIEKEIDQQQPVRTDAMPRLERVKRTTELQEQLLQLEQREEALIVHAAGDGLEILRRPDASPLAVLGVVIAQAQAQQVA
jgi:hypothetical protein